MKKWTFPVLFAGVILGTVFVNISGSTLVEESGVFGSLYIQRLTSIQPKSDDMFWYIVGTRLKEMAILVLLMMTPLRRFLPGGLVFGCGFINGMLTSIGMIQQGYGGVLLFWLLSLPAYLLFYPGMFYLCENIRRTNSRNLFMGIIAGIAVIFSCAALESGVFLLVIKKIYL